MSEHAWTRDPSTVEMAFARTGDGWSVHGDGAGADTSIEHGESHDPDAALLDDVPLSTEKLLGKGTSGVSNGEAQYVKANGTHHDIGLRPHSPGHSQDEDGDGVGEPVSDIVFSPEFSRTGFEVVPERAQEDGCTVTQSIFNLANTIVGAGVMALPRVIAELGIAMGVLAISLCAFISIFALESIVWESDTTRQTVSYGALVESQFGRGGGMSMQAAIIMNNFGIMIVYLIIASDVLVGSSDIRGVLPVIFGTPTGDEAPWYTSKEFVLFVVTVTCLLPLVCLKSLQRLSVASMMSIAIALAFTVTTTVLGVTALGRGKEAPVDMLPDAEALGGSFVSAAKNVLQALPVVLTAYNCHFNIHSIMGELKGYSQAKMSVVIRSAVLLCCVMYIAVGVGAYVVFGAATKADVLASFGRENLEHLLGGTGAVVVATLAKTLYTATLVVTFPMINWALRINAFEIVSNKTPDPGSVSWYTVTVVLLMMSLLFAITIPSIFIAIELTGATAGVLIAFFWPMVLLLKIKRDREELGAKTVMAAGAVLFLGLLVMVIGIWESIDTMRGVSEHG